MKRKSPKWQLRALMESSATSRKLNETVYLYHGFRLFSRSEAILFCSWWRDVAAGVVGGSASAGDAGGGRLIVERRAVCWEPAELIEKPKDGTGRRRKGRRPTGKERTAVGIGPTKGMEERWMMPLQGDCSRGL